jgi:nucleotide-binding universal stress UspA family protein
MELIILTIGLQQQIINDKVYAMMVVMALVTTAMTTPLLHWIVPVRLPAVAPAREPRAARGYTVLVPVSLPESGPALARVAAALVAQHPGQGRILALHLRRPSEHEAYRAGLDDSLADAPLAPLTPLMAQATKHKLPVEPISFVSSDIAEDIAAVAMARDVDLILMGFHKPVFGKTILGGTVHRVLQQSPTDVAILVDRGLEDSKRILVPYLGSSHDRLAMELAARLARATGAAVTVLHVVDPSGARPRLGARQEMERVFNQEPAAPPVTFRVVEDPSPVNVVLREGSQYDLVVVGLTEEWGLESKLIGFRSERLARELPGSLLIVHKGAAASASAESAAGTVSGVQAAKL